MKILNVIVPFAMKNLMMGELIQPFLEFVIMNFISHALIIGYLVEELLVQFVARNCQLLSPRYIVRCLLCLHCFSVNVWNLLCICYGIHMDFEEINVM